MNEFSSLFHQLVRKLCTGPCAVTPVTLLENLLKELQKAGMLIQDDAVCLTLCRCLWGGTIGQLTNDENDPGYVNRASGATEGFYPRDPCGSAQRKGRGIAMAVRVWTPNEFVAADKTGTLQERAQKFEQILSDHILLTLQKEEGVA